jgi:hypothetical protein
MVVLKFATPTRTRTNCAHTNRCRVHSKASTTIGLSIHAGSSHHSNSFSCTTYTILQYTTDLSSYILLAHQRQDFDPVTIQPQQHVQSNHTAHKRLNVPIRIQNKGYVSHFTVRQLLLEWDTKPFEPCTSLFNVTDCDRDMAIAPRLGVAIGVSLEVRIGFSTVIVCQFEDA